MNLKSFRNSVVLLCFMAAGLAANAQSGSQPQYFLPQLMPRSPNATALEKYGTYQVNEFTGVPDISIPLYTIDAGGFNIPITLSYHASGIKISDAATWAGLGWSVIGGGQVSRRVMGLPDDNAGGYLYGHMRQPGTYSSTTHDGVHYLDSAATNLCDTRPDIYSYDFTGHSGKFFFDGSAGQNYVPRLLPFAPLKIAYNRSDALHFTITDEHGDIYSFGGVGAVDTTYTETEGTNEQTSGSAWKLVSMISQNRRDTVSFSYQADEMAPPNSDTEIYTVTDNCVALPSVIYTPSYSAAPRYIGNFVDNKEKLPQQINFKNGKVVFEVDATAREDMAGGRRLKDIKVYQYNYSTKQMELQKTIVFYHGYFGATKRLRLDSIQMQDKAGNVMQHYRFDYNTALTLPDYLSYAQDYWGYYNGFDGSNAQPPNTMLTPRQSINYNPGTPTHVIIGQANRNPDSTYMQACILTGIHYPSGGYSTFTYQTNQYDTSGVKALAGGLRIRTISSYDGTNPTPIVKTYVYNSARANFFLDYSYFYTIQTHRYYEFERISCNLRAYADVRSFSSTPHTDLEAYDGATVVYPSVTEYIGTPGTNIGRTDYTFTDLKDSYLDASVAGTLVYLSAFYVRGHLLSKKEYVHKADGSYQPVQLTTNTYTAFPQRQYGNVGLVVRKLYYNEGCGSNPIEPGQAFPQDDTYAYVPTPTYYDIISDDNYLTSTTTHLYDTNDTTKYSTSTVSYRYDDTTHQQVAATTHTDSKGNTHVTANKYAFDYLSGGTTNNTVLDSMINRHMYADVVEKWDTLKNAATSVNAVTAGQLNRYKFGGITNTIVPDKISTLSVAQPLTDFTPSTVTSGVLTGDTRYVQMISFDNYDGNNNLLQYTARNSTPVSIMWDYLGENPVAQVKNSVYTNVAYTGFEADGKGGWTYSGAPVFDPTAPTGSMVYPLSSGSITSPTVSSSLAYVVSYWTNGAVATVTPTGGSAVTGTLLNSANGWNYYEHRVPAGASTLTVSGSTSIDELRMYPANSQMTTYAYDPSGLRSIADAKGTNSYFEYDFFQRLKNIKDWAGNIVKNYGYHMYDMTVGNQTQTATFTRNNCPYGYTPGSLTFTVPANRYYGTSQASANADAIYDMNLNGQIKANANCGCPMTISVTNSTGIANYPVYFSGITSPILLPAGSSNVVVPEGTYTTVTVGPSGSGTYNFTLGTRPVQSGVHYATFSTVVIAPGGSDLTLTIN